MKSIKQQFNEFRETTPKHVQWLLLGAFVLIVVILVALLWGGKTKNHEGIESANQKVSFVVKPDVIHLTDTFIGKSARETITVSVNTPVVIDSVDVEAKEITVTNNCDNLTETCLINIVYKPTIVQPETETKLNITWHIENQAEIINSVEVPVTFSSKEEQKPIEEKKQEIKEEPLVESKPAIEPEPVLEPEEEEIVIEENEEDDDVEEIEFEPEPVVPVKEKIVEDIKSVVPANLFEEPKIEKFELPAEKCSDFAIAAYDQSGNAIGWIKPEGGANYFHPFSDKDCSNPTGKYNPATGIITSLKDGSKIGTDSDHIGYRNVRSRNLSVPNLSMPDGFSDSSVANADGTFSGEPVWESGVEQKTPFVMDLSHTEDEEILMGSAALPGNNGEYVTSSKPFDRTFILRQFKPIPATIVSEVRADPSVYGYDKSGNKNDGGNYSIPVRATVDRNVFSDDGRTIIIPTGTLLMGYLDGELPGPYQSVGRMNIKWYQFIRPDGVEFNFEEGQDPYSADAQGRAGVPGHGSTDYVEQMVMPILTSLVPAAVNMIAPIADTVINQIDLDNNTIVQSGTMRSSEMAKQEVISTWNKVAQKLMVDALDNTTPPFSIAAGTRINVFSPVDLIVSCEGTGKKCDVIKAGKNPRRPWSELKEKAKTNPNDPSWVGQVRSFNIQNKYCSNTNGKWTINEDSDWGSSGYDYRTILMYCESLNYEAINNKKNQVYSAQVQKQYDEKYKDNERAYNEDILGLTYDDDGNIENPWAKPSKVLPAIEDESVTCDDGSAPDINGCCTGETYTDNGPMDPDNPDGPHEFVCCPAGDGDCFPPLVM